MKSKHAGLTILGLTAAFVGSYWLTQSYLKARTNCPPFRRRVYRHSREMMEAFGAFWRHPEAIKALRENERLGHPLTEKIMLAVTSVNGGRQSSPTHMRYAMQRGLARQESESLLRGQIEYASMDEAPALYFARHYAEHRERPDADMVQRLSETYGPRMAQDIVTYARFITFGNLLGNTLDALVSRALGRPSSDTTLRGELSVLVALLFGVLPLLPVLAWRVGHIPAKAA